MKRKVGRKGGEEEGRKKGSIKKKQEWKGRKWIG